MDKLIVRLQSDFPDHSFDVQKGMFGQQLLVDGTVAVNTWDLGSELVNNPEFSAVVRDMNAEDMLYYFLKENITKYLAAKGVING